MPSPSANTPYLPTPPTTAGNLTPTASSKTRPLPPRPSSSRQPFATSPLKASVTASRVNSLEGKENWPPIIPKIVIQRATGDESTFSAVASAQAMSRQSSVICSSQPTVRREARGRPSVASESSSSVGRAEGIFSASLCDSPRPASVTIGSGGSPSQTGKGKGRAEEPKPTVPPPTRVEYQSLRDSARPRSSADKPAQSAVPTSAHPQAGDDRTRSSAHTRAGDIHTPHSGHGAPTHISPSHQGGTHKPPDTQIPTSERSRGRSPSIRDIGTSRSNHPAPEVALPARVAALRPVHSPQKASSQKDSQAPRSAEEHSRPARPLTPLSLHVGSPDRLTVPIRSPSKSLRTVDSIRRQAHQDSPMTDSESSCPSPFSRLARNTSNTSRSSARDASGCDLDWIAGPSTHLEHPSTAFTTASAPPIQSKTLQRRVCKSTMKTDPSLTAIERVLEAKQDITFSSPTQEETERGRAGGKVDPMNGHYVAAYDPEKPPRSAHAVLEPQVPRPLEVVDGVETEGGLLMSPCGRAESYATPESPRFSPLSQDSPQYVPVPEMVPSRSYNFFSKSKLKQRLYVDRNDPSWPLVDLQHWDIPGASIMTQEDHRNKEERIQNHKPSTSRLNRTSRGEREDDSPPTTIRQEQRLYVTNPDERDDCNESILTTNHGEKPTHEPITNNARRREDGDAPHKGDDSNTTQTRNQYRNAAVQHSSERGGETPRKHERQPKHEHRAKMTSISFHGSWMDEMTMRRLFKLLEETLRENQKVRVVVNPSSRR